MGGTVGKIVKGVFAKTEVRVLMVGLDAAGKTTILYKLKLGEIVTTIPTIGFNVETLAYKNINFTVWDVSGRGKIRALWRHYYQNTQGVIYVIDSNDRERLDEVKEELDRMLNEDEIRDAAWLFMANKQDLPNAMSVAELTEQLGLNTRLRGRKWYIQSSCSTTGDGLYEGLDWFSNALAGDMATSGISSMFDSFKESSIDYLQPTPPASKPKPLPKIEPQVDPKDPRKLILDAKTTTSTPIDSLKPYLSSEDEVKLLSKYSVDSWDNLPLDEINNDKANINKNNNNDQKAEVVESSGIWAGELKDDQNFLTAFEDCGSDPAKSDLVDALDRSWSHVAFLRMIWLYLTLEGRRKAVSKIMDGTKKFFEYRKHAVSVFHITLVYFWLQIVDYCIRSNLPKQGEADTTKGSFKEFIKQNLFLLNDELFLQYYSVDAIFHNPDSMKEFLLPNKKQLPSIVMMKPTTRK